ncbi:MAG: periplasmic heavy metal sensor [Candidatus Omnitrophota bacterium]
MMISCSQWFRGGLLGVVGLVLAAGVVGAQPSDRVPMKDGRDVREQRGRNHFIEMSERLKLSKEQQTLLEQNREQHRVEFDTVMKQLLVKRDELRQTLDAPELNMQDVSRVHRELKDLMNIMEDRHLTAVLEIRQILTPQQFKQFQAMAPDKHGPPPGPPLSREGIK